MSATTPQSPRPWSPPTTDSDRIRWTHEMVLKMHGEMASNLGCTNERVAILEDALRRQIADVERTRETLLREVGMGVIDEITLANSKAALAANEGGAV